MPRRLRIAAKFRAADRCHSYRPGTDPTPARCRSRTDTPEPRRKPRMEPLGAPPRRRNNHDLRRQVPIQERLNLLEAPPQRTSRTTPPAPSHARPHRSAPPPPAAHPPPRCAATTPTSTPPPSAQKDLAATPTPEKRSRHTQDPEPNGAGGGHARRRLSQTQEAGPAVREPAQALKAPSEFEPRRSGVDAVKLAGKLDQLDPSHRRAIPLARPELQDPRVATRTFARSAARSRGTAAPRCRGRGRPSAPRGGPARSPLLRLRDRASRRTGEATWPWPRWC